MQMGGGKLFSPASETSAYGGSDGRERDRESNPVLIPRETALQALNTIVQLHFEKTLEKKRTVDLQKKELWKMFLFFFIFLAILFSGVVQSTKMQCVHCWMPIVLCSLGHALFYAAMSQTLQCINAFKYQRRCHKLTLGLATEKLNRLKTTSGESVLEEDFEVRYQEPGESYLGKFRRKWALFFLFLLITFCFMNAAMAILLCS